MRDRRKKPKRRWWQLLCRIAALVAILLVCAYATLPWWAPTGLIREYLTDQMSRQVGAPVTIGSLKLDWSRGIELGDLKISSRPGFDPQPMIHVPRMRLELSPYNLFVRKRVAWMEIDQPTMFIQVDSDRNINAAAMDQLQFEAQPDQVSIRRATVLIKLPEHDRLLRLNVRDMEYVAGRVSRLGKVTMSAELEQRGGAAPVGLQVAAGTNRAEVAAAVSFNFSRIDLQQLPIIRMLGLPLKRLNGRCEGSLHLQLNRQAIVDHFSFNVKVHRLDAQPLNGPKLPVIESAGIRISAAFDPFAPGGGELSIQSASIRLPGIDLAGQAKMSVGALAGQWEGIHSLNLKGAIYPTRLAALLGDRPALPLGLHMNGPVYVQMDSSRDGHIAKFTLTAGANSADIRQGKRLLKPAGRALTLKLAGNFDRRNWKLTADSSELKLADNCFRGSGTVRNLRDLATRWTKAKQPSLRQAAADLANIRWRGEWEISEINSLRDFFPPLDAAIGKKAKLNGKITGRWRIERDTETQLHASLTIPAETQLSLDGVMAKPDKATIHLRLDGTVDESKPGLKDMNLTFSVASGKCTLDHGYVSLTTGKNKDNSIEIDAGGQFRAEQIDRFLPCFPAAAELQAAGTINGKYTFQAENGTQRTTLTANLEKASLAWRNLAKWTAGQKGTLTLELLSVPKNVRLPLSQLQCSLRCPEATLNTKTYFARAVAATKTPKRVFFSANLNAKDARWLTARCPALGKQLGGGKLTGAMQLEVLGNWQPGTIEAQIILEGAGLEYASGGAEKRSKAKDVPFGLFVTCKCARKKGKLLDTTIQRATIRLGQSRVNLEGYALLSKDRNTPLGKHLLGRDLLEGSTHIGGLIAFDKALVNLLPEAGRYVSRHGLTGAVKFDAVLLANRKDISLNCDLAGEKLAAKKLGKFTLPAGTKAECRFHLAAPASLSRIDLNIQEAKVGDLNVRCVSQIGLKLDSRGLPVALGKKSGRLIVQTPQAETLASLMPDLVPYAPGGGAKVELDCTDLDELAFRTVRLTADKLRGRYRGKDAELSGNVLVEGLKLWPDRLPVCRHLKTDDLEMRAGKNHAWLIADTSHLPDKPTGQVHLLGTYLDDKDLTDWLSPAPTATTQSGKITASEVDKLESLARQTIATAHKHLVTADLDVRADIDKLIKYDNSVGLHYEVRNAAIDATVKRGRIKLQYVVGLYGGTIRTTCDLDITEANPAVSTETETCDIIATKNIQPQMTKYFPGNTVYGYFNRSEKLTFYLRNFIANAADPRYSLRPTGQAKTITFNGLVEGRAAPRFVTHLFPGLNLAKYRYKKMTGFAKFLPDGSAINDMIFSGHTYDIYIDGKTDPKNIGTYEIGLILLGTPQSPEWNHTYRQGRIPILKWKARIEGGKLHDEEVAYPWPNETLFVIFLKNNIFYRIWLNARKK